MSIDDLVLTWLSPEAHPAEPEPVSDDRDCPSCGYSGAMIVEQGRLICPACLGISPVPLDEAIRRIVRCPNCDVEILVSDRDRNKTIVCSRCKFFLGCIYRDEPSRQLEVFGVHLPSLLRRLTYALSVRPRCFSGPSHALPLDDDTAVEDRGGSRYRFDWQRHVGRGN
jgi:hypothetical protein